MGYIYKITHKASNRAYIGQTTLDVEERWRSHLKNSSKCRYLKHALKRYGKDAFDFRIICICFDDALDKYEKEYIAKYNTLVPQGFNLRLGGNMKGKQHEETKRLISEKVKQHMLAPDFVHAKPQLGKTLSKETKEKISESLKGRKHSEETLGKLRTSSTKYRVVQSLNGIDIRTHMNTIEAAKFFGVTNTFVSNVCRGVSRSCRGYSLRYIPAN